VARRSSILVTVLVTVVAAGCTAPRPTPAASPSPRAPVVATDRAGAQAQLAAYVKVNNRANQASSDTLLRTYEGGASLAIDLAEYKSERILHPKGGAKYDPFGYADATYFFPEGRTWFIANVRQYDLATKKKDDKRTYLLFVKKGDGWRQMYSPDTETADEVVDKPADKALDPADSAGLLASPDKFAKLYAEQLMGKTAVVRSNLFEGDQLARSNARTTSKLSGTSDVTRVVKPARAYPTYAVRTADGGAMVFTTLSMSVRFDVRPNQQHNYVFQTENGFLRKKYYSYMRLNELVQVAAHIPPKGAQNNKFKVFATYSGIISGSGA
jgi:hypothetical protein